MSESNYHLEALRKTRVLERKRYALEKLTTGGQVGDGTCETKGNVTTKDQIMFSGPGDFDNNSLNSYDIPSAYRMRPRPNICGYVPPPNVESYNLTLDDDVMVDRLIKYMGPTQKIYHRKVDNNPEDKVYPLLHPQEYEIKRTIKQLPPRKPHYKV